MPAIRTSAPAAEPVTLALVKQHLRIDHTEHDDLLTMYITSCRMWAEEYTARTFCTTLWRESLHSFPYLPYRSICLPDDYAIQLPMSPIISVQSIEYIVADGTSAMLPPADYLLDIFSVRGCVSPAVGKTWPQAQNRPGAVTIDYTAGFGPTAADVPTPIRHWLLLAVAEAYNQGGLTTDTKRQPSAFDCLLDAYKIWTV